MAQSWSSMRKALEQDNLCDALKGRIQYFATRYHKVHNEYGRVAVRYDGEEILSSSSIEILLQECVVRKTFPRPCIMQLTMSEYHDAFYDEVYSQGGFDYYALYKAYYYYQNHSIQDSLNSPNPLVRLFAILDKRVGKRTLHKLVNEINQQPPWLQVFYILRMDAEGIGRNQQDAASNE